jgi:glutamine amidotransferase
MTTNQTIGIVSAGLGNIGSIMRMIEKVGGNASAINNASQIYDYDKLILPGVGHFDEGISRLRDSGFAEAITNIARNNITHVLGICLGMQMLCRGSDEGILPGLGLIDADVKKFSFPPEMLLKVPHMGWNTVSVEKPNSLLPMSEIDQRFYFVHSYRVVPDNPSISIGSADYGVNFCAAFQKRTIWGVQFHPEKSHRFGMNLMRRFIVL